MLNNIAATLGVGVPPGPSVSYESIATVNGTGSSSTITFSSISGGYSHLQIRGIARSTAGTAAFGGVQITFNGDSTSGNYSFHRVIGDGSSASSYGQSGLDFIMRSALNGLASSIYASNVVDILDYSNTNKYKTTRTLNGGDNNSTVGVVGLFSQVWVNTAAITSITLTVSTGNFTTDSSFALYGIK